MMDMIPRGSKGLSYEGRLNTEVFYGLFTGCRNRLLTKVA